MFSLAVLQRVVRRLARHLHVVNMALAQAGIGDPDEPGPLLKLAARQSIRVQPERPSSGRAPWAIGLLAE